MKKNRLVSILAILAGVLFIFTMGSDIQLGFGCVLIVQGLLAWE